MIVFESTSERGGVILSKNKISFVEEIASRLVFEKTLPHISTFFKYLESCISAALVCLCIKEKTDTGVT